MTRMFWKDRRVLVTGATGLVGSWLVKELIEQNAYVVGLIRDWNPQSELFQSGAIHKIHCVTGELQSYQCLERAINEHEVDTVFHLGAQAIVGSALRSPLETFESNIRGTYNLLEACRQHSHLVKRIVIASSDKAYGSSDSLPYKEEMPPLGQHPYDVSKSCADLIAQAYAKTYQLPIAIARCGNIYGGGDLNWSRIIPGTIKSLCEKNRPIIRSDGTMTRDYLYVKDVVGAYLLLAEHVHHSSVKGEAFNFGPTKPYSVLEIVDLLRVLMSCQDLEPLVLNQVNLEIPHQYLCSQKARSILHWNPQFSLQEGLMETIAWYEKYLNVLEMV